MDEHDFKAMEEAGFDRYDIRLAIDLGKHAVKQAQATIKMTVDRHPNWMLRPYAYLFAMQALSEIERLAATSASNASMSATSASTSATNASNLADERRKEMGAAKRRWPRIPAWAMPLLQGWLVILAAVAFTMLSKTETIVALIIGSAVYGALILALVGVELAKPWIRRIFKRTDRRK
jgi:hypothetical protein